MTPTRLVVIKPLTICQFQLEVGDEFDVTEWNETDFGTFFRPMDVPHMPSGTGWLFTEKTFEVIEWDEPEDDFDAYGEEAYDDSWSDDDADELEVRNYIENRQEEGVEPTLKQIQGRMKDSGLTCLQIKGLVESLGYGVQNDDDVSLSKSRVYFT